MKRVRRRAVGKFVSRGSNRYTSSMLRPRLRTQTRTVTTTPGFTRTGGFYGRFPPSGGEQKFFDTSISFNFDSTGEVPATGQLNLIPQGVTESTRIGRKCVVKSISMKLTFYFPPGAGEGTARSWLGLVLDKQANGAAAAITDIFTGTNASTTFRNMANSTRFQILKFWNWNWNSTAGVTGAWGSLIKYLTFTKRCNIPLEFSSTTGALTELKSNNIFLIAGSTVVDDIISCSGTVRVRFADN